MAAHTDRGIPLSALNPNYLHSNSTSHTWPFSAIAELIDNAYDPDVSAKQFWVDKTMVKGQDCLTFMDNGEGMDYDKMHKMLSFGFSDKQTVNSHVPVGIYGNGFKSGSMRLGKDAIVFSKKADTMCVGLLSQTYLEQIKAEHVAVPIAMFRCTKQTSCPVPAHTASLQDILRYSLFQTEEELLCELDAIKGPCSTNSTGTRIIIWNLRKSSSGQSEFDYSADRYDIRIPADVYESSRKQYKKPEHIMQSGPESDFSLRAYCSILYLKPRMQIIIRGQKVKTELVSKSLAKIQKDKYRPKFQNLKPIPITFGYNTKSKEQYGIMMYHKNRLIKAYERVACQLKANSKGVGVIGVIECNFLKPTHNKQDFDYTEEYRKTMCSLNIKLEEYSKEVHHRFQKNSDVLVQDIPNRPDQNWVQCDDCLKWRKLPDCIDTEELPSKWFCRMNPDPQFRSCVYPEEPEDSDDEQVYQKTYKQHERNEKLKQVQSRQQMEQEQKKAEQQRMSALTNQKPVLKKDLERQFHLGTTSPRCPIQSTVMSTPNSSRLRSADSRSPDNMPVISSVISLFTPARKKRSLGQSARNGVEKRTRLSDSFSGKTPGSPSTSTASPEACASPSTIIFDDRGGKEAWRGAQSDDDDIVVIESNSTPRPNLFTCDLSIVKTENCNDDANTDTSAAVETTIASALTVPVRQICSTAQTESTQAIKQEVECSEGKEGEGRSKERERGTCQPDTALLPLERSSNQDQETSYAVTAHDDGETGSEFMDLTQNPPDGEHLMAVVPHPRDDLARLLETTTQERDRYQTQVHLLTSRVEELEKLHQEQVETAWKKESEPGAEEKEYKARYLQAQGEMRLLQLELDELKREKAQAGVEIKVEDQCSSAAEGAPREGGLAATDMDDELACQVDFVMRELDRKIKQNEELENRLKNLEDENSCLLTLCESLQKNLGEVKNVKLSVDDRGSQTGFPHHNQDESGLAAAGPSLQGCVSQDEIPRGPKSENGHGDSSTQTSSHMLRELRHNVARLLVNYVPALDLQQVNFDCDVIDDILAQVLEIGSSPPATEQSS